MKRMKVLYASFLVAVMLLAVSACGVSSVTEPTATADPVSASSIQNSDAIVITFNVDMDSKTLVLTGNMADESNGGVWSNTGVNNGSLKISPSADSNDTWAAGERTLNIKVSSSSGASLSLNLTYTVVAPAPTASVVPAPTSPESFIGSDFIVVSFSISMDPSTLVLTGDMAVESDGGIWSTASEHKQNDTLVISPKNFWTGNVSTLTINVDSAEGIALSALTLDYTIDVETPVATESPAEGSTINGDAVLIITFNRTMQIPTLDLSGALGNESDGGVWSTVSILNDTLTINPSTTWTDGLSRDLTINVEADNGISLPTKTLNYDVDTNQPTASVTPSSGDRITGGKPVVIDFNESMDIATLNASGTLLANGDDRAWSPANDQLTITPSSAWPAGNNRTLTVNIDDLVGNSLTPLALNYTVDITAPTASVNPANNTFLYGSDKIVVSFSERMNPTQFSSSGLLFSSVATANWSNANKTLTFSAVTSWPVATNSTLNITAEDVAGNPTVLNLIYTVATDECSDGVITLDETDIDCGGAICQSCSIGEKCLNNADCSSVLCDTGGTLICLASCGDSTTTPPEQCDDGGESAACNLDCTTALCGDAITNTTAGETCDDGVESATCNTNCTTALCGDSVTNTTAGETCDDGAESATCNTNCTTALCGDAITNTTAGETCDDGAESATCNTNCTTAVCGDATTNTTAGETCDDGGESAACNLNCTVAVCGDTIINATAGETCDDGNVANGDGCSSSCTVEAICGDNVTTAPEQCDDGGESASCNLNCTIAACGDTLINTTAGETCDDGNLADGDGCSSTCTVEAICGDNVTTAPEQCDDGGESASCNLNCTIAACGDTLINTTAGETCDDGNLVNGDGCDSSCQLEP